MKRLMLFASHVVTLAVGFALGVYMLPILTAQKSPDAQAIAAAGLGAEFKGRFDRRLKGSDFLHWGEGEVWVSRQKVVHAGRLSPGPDYKLYLTPSFVDTKEGFLKIKEQSRAIADIKSYQGFIVEVPLGVDVAQYSTVVVWCEAFGAFISAAKYR